MNNILSIIIPSRNERFLPNTVVDLLDKAKQDIEIIVILDGYWTIPSYFEPQFVDLYNRMITDKRVTLLHRGEAQGMRPGINSAVALAKGDYIMKTDGHCLFDEGYDVKLKENCESNWVVIPRRKRLDAENWAIQDVGKPDIDYEYLSFPDNPADFGGPGFNGRIWTERILERINDPKYDIDENMSFQGSCWFMQKEYFHALELMDYENYGTFWSEAQEIGFKSWLSGGKVMINKKTWYAHLHKGRTYGRGYKIDNRTIEEGTMFSNKWVHNNAWSKQTLPFHTMIERFMPLPGWEADWKQKLNYTG
jgi:glycosyltransferase involved in cell wall biosynthesis